MSADRFTITVHQQARVLEVRYPPRPTLEAFSRYVTEVKAAIAALGSSPPWDCIVDQSSLRALGPDFPPRISELNMWAISKGMRRTARLVSDSAVGELQTLRILRNAGVSEVGAIFRSRDEAWAFVTRPSR